jgi:hypothetical protein
MRNREEELKSISVFRCVTGLLIIDPAAPPIRITADVDVITGVAAYFDLSYFSEATGWWRRSPHSDAKCDGAES